MESTLIKGYRDLKPHEVSLINEAKELAEKVGDFVTRIEEASTGAVTKDHPEETQVLASHFANGHVAVDKRWLAISKTELQKAFMFLNRSIARPTTF